MLTVGILTYTLNYRLHDLTVKCLQSFKSQADEIVFVENGGNWIWEYRDKNLIHVKYNTNQGYTRGVNTILRLAKEPYILFVSNDIQLIDGELKDLCIPNTVTSPKIFPSAESGFAGAMFCVPRTVLDSVGYLDESMKLRYSDEDFNRRLLKAGIKIKSVDSVVVNHEVDQTIHLTMEMSTGDKEAYESKN